MMNRARTPRSISSEGAHMHDRFLSSIACTLHLNTQLNSHLYQISSRVYRHRSWASPHTQPRFSSPSSTVNFFLIAVQGFLSHLPWQQVSSRIQGREVQVSGREGRRRFTSSSDLVSSRICHLPSIIHCSLHYFHWAFHIPIFPSTLSSPARER